MPEKSAKKHGIGGERERERDTKRRKEKATEARSRLTFRLIRIYIRYVCVPMKLAVLRVCPGSSETLEISLKDTARRRRATRRKRQTLEELHNT